MNRPGSEFRLDEVRRRLEAHRPRHDERGERLRAAVAVVLRPSPVAEVLGEPEVLFIRRAERAGDPWSGHIAFPGGRLSPEDPHVRATAERETQEEVGLALADAHYAGRLDDLTGLSESVRVSAFCYLVEDPPPLVLNHEVRAAFWVPLADLLDPSRHVTLPHSYRESVFEFPAVKVADDEGLPLWGMTYRFVEGFLGLLGHAIPGMPWHDED